MILENASEESSSRHAALESSLCEVLFQIIRFADEKKDHIPTVQNSEIISFPFGISTPRLLCPDTILYVLVATMLDLVH